MDDVPGFTWDEGEQRWILDIKLIDIQLLVWRTPLHPKPYRYEVSIRRGDHQFWRGSSLTDEQAHLICEPWSLVR